jgi:hypothetical protein
MIATNPTLSWRSELRDSHSLRAWVIFPMRRAALLDMLKATLRYCTSKVVDCEEMENLAKCKSNRDYIMPNFKASKAEVRNSPPCSTTSGWAMLLGCQLRLWRVGRALLGIDFEAVKYYKVLRS